MCAGGYGHLGCWFPGLDGLGIYLYFNSWSRKPPLRIPQEQSESSWCPGSFDEAPVFMQILPSPEVL